MKYSTPITLYYVCPFTFIVESVNIDLSYREDDDLYYISEEGAYLKEHDLFETLEEARGEAFSRLNKFYNKKLKEIQGI